MSSGPPERPGRIGPGHILRGLREEVAATLAIVRRTTGWFWVGLLFVFACLALPGLLPLGRASVFVQCLSLSVFGLVLIQPEGLALEFRKDDEAELSGREDGEVVAYLPALLVLAAFPLYIVGQAVLFQRVMVHYPGILEGTGWADAWRISLNNLLYTEILFDAADVFRFGLAPDPDHRVGQAMVFVTRALLSLAFIKTLIQMGRAAYFRAHGLGRGVDHGSALASAVVASDGPGIRHAAEGLKDGLADAVDRLVRRRAVSGDDPVVPRSHPSLLQALLTELEEGVAPPRRAPKPWRLWRFLLPPVLLAGLLLALGSVGGWPALASGLLVLIVLAWLLVTPKSSLERAVLLGVVPHFPTRHLVRWTLLWAALLSLALMPTAWLVFGAAAEVFPGAFVAPAGPDPMDMGRFVLANLLRLQLFFGAPDIFAFGLPPVEQRPVVGSLLTLLFRSALNVGLVAVALTTLSVSYSRAAGASRLLGNDELTIRIEADRGGLFSADLIRHHAESLKEEVWDLLRTAAGARERRTLAFTGLFDWVPDESPGLRLGDLLPTALVAAWYAEIDRPETALALLGRVDADGRAGWLLQPARTQLMAVRAQILAGTGRPAEARLALAEAERELARTGAGMVPADRADTEEEIVRARACFTPPRAAPKADPAP